MKAVSRLLVAAGIFGTIVACNDSTTAPIAAGSFRATITGKTRHTTLSGRANADDNFPILF